MQGKIHPVFIANQEPYDVFKVLCTGASQYAPYSLLLISSKFWMGGGEVGSRWGRSEVAELEGENKKGGGGE
jgi:hypothetical protein